MKIERRCCYCQEVIPEFACQHSQIVNGEFYPLHVGCADEWAKELVPVWTIDFEDYGYTTGNFEDVLSEVTGLNDLARPEIYTDEEWIKVTPRRMPRVEFLLLPEVNF